jgi:hypothetical protein
LSKKREKPISDDATQELETAIRVARTALAKWEENPTPANFRIWRDASEIAVKWHRAARMAGESTADFDRELALLTK